MYQMTSLALPDLGDEERLIGSKIGLSTFRLKAMLLQYLITLAWTDLQ